MITEKERLENELKLLKESFEMDVVSRDEYETAKARIDEQIQELSSEQKKEPDVEKKTKIESEETKTEYEEKSEETKTEPADDGEEIKKYPEEETKPEPSGEEFVKKETEEDKEEEEEEEKLGEIKEGEKVAEIIDEEGKKPEEEAKFFEQKQEEEKPQFETYKGKKKGGKKIFAYVVIILIIGFISGYFLFSGDNDSEDISSIEPEEDISFIACSSDDDCIEEGKIGACKNPGVEDSECEYIRDVEIKLTVLNADCFNCDTGRVLNILKSFFSNTIIENVDFETKEGKELVETFDIEALPAYIFDSGFTDAHNYDKFSSSFNEIDGSFVMKNTVANSNYYIKRTEIENKLDLFVKAGQNASLKAEENLKEFLESFDGIVNFEKHSSNSAIVKELGINTFPTFLVNNIVKFSGAQAADTIKENFCEMNLADECDLELSKSLV